MSGTALGPLQERKKVIDPKFDRAKLAGLEPNTKYRIEIRAMTKAGEGDRYYVEQSTGSVAAAMPDVPLFQTDTLPAPTKEGMFLICPNSDAGVREVNRFEWHHKFYRVSQSI